MSESVKKKSKPKKDPFFAKFCFDVEDAPESNDIIDRNFSDRTVESITENLRDMFSKRSGVKIDKSTNLNEVPEFEHPKSVYVMNLPYTRYSEGDRWCNLFTKTEKNITLNHYAEMMMTRFTE